MWRKMGNPEDWTQSVAARITPLPALWTVGWMCGKCEREVILKRRGSEVHDLMAV